ncbi:MAG TPA: hypothetical protein DHW64_01255 [Chitinophagaceae bacterium]|nr:hypothetical protein [Chitinophagaceae bacterium]
MTAPERFYQFMEYKRFRPRWVEMECGLSNGYLGKQRKNKGSFGGGILLRIEKRFPELNITWLLSGEGEMLNATYRDVKTETFNTVEEESATYGLVMRELVPLLKQQISQLEAALTDKQKLIEILEHRIKED